MKLVADLHVHSISSGHAYSTIEEYATYAAEIGLQAFALTDHGPNMPGAPHYYHFSNLKMVPEKIKGVKVYRGIEANVISAAGETDIPTKKMMFTAFEIVILSMHPRCGYDPQSKKRNTEVLLKALSKQPEVNILGHPGNPMFPIDVEAVVTAAKKHGVAIELNNSSRESRVGSYEACLAFAKEVKRQDGLIAVGSDAHFSSMLGGFDYSLQLIKEAGLTEKHVVNTSLDKIDKYLVKK
ncbi:MAG: phosphatase [bacterium]